MKKRLLKLCFAPDGGAGAGGAAGGQTGAAEGMAQAGVKQGSPDAGEAGQRGRRGNGLGNVVYGKQLGAAQEGQEQAAAAQEPGKNQGKTYSDQDVQDIVSKRLGKVNQQLRSHQDTLKAQQPVIDLLMKRYGVKDAGALLEAVNQDEGMWREGADRRGVSWEDERDRTAQSVREAQMQARITELENQQHASEKLAQWETESNALKQMYPDFDLNTEIENQEFAKLLSVGYDLKTAYKVVHMDEIMNNGIAYAARTAQQQTADAIRARGMRPVENGMNSGAGKVFKTDISQTTREDRAEIARQVAMGKRITF